MRWVGHVVHMGEGRGVYRVLVRRPKGRWPLTSDYCQGQRMRGATPPLPQYGFMAQGQIYLTLSYQEPR
jgi:hypothetical protein